MERRVVPNEELDPESGSLRLCAPLRLCVKIRRSHLDPATCRFLDSLRSLGMTVVVLRSLGMTVVVLRSLGMTAATFARTERRCSRPPPRSALQYREVRGGVPLAEGSLRGTVEVQLVATVDQTFR